MERRSRCQRGGGGPQGRCGAQAYHRMAYGLTAAGRQVHARDPHASSASDRARRNRAKKGHVLVPTTTVGQKTVSSVIRQDVCTSERHP